jgi:NAD+ kinase
MNSNLILGILAYPERPLISQALKAIQAWAAQNKDVQFISHQSLKEESFFECVSDSNLKSAHVLIAIGGDGTLLSAARLASASGTPLLGINTGKIGFLTDFPLSSLSQTLDNIKAGDYGIEDRMMLDFRVFRQGEYISGDAVLNEIHIRNASPEGLMKLRVELNNGYLTDYLADSLLIATPTGSTAYNLSAGGPIMYPTTEAIVLTPVNATSLSVRPMVIPSFYQITVQEVSHQSAILVLDGRISFGLKAGDIIQISKSKSVTHLIKSEQYGFIDALREKLGWTGSPRTSAGENI